jgi:tetratricopeptide (TPR) repeat protein
VPADVDVYRRRARARAGAGDLAGVVEDYTLALAIQRQPALLTARGWAQLVNGSPRQALADFQEALARAPGHADALVGRGSARLELGERRLAVADIEAGLGRRPGSPRVLYSAARGLALLGQGGPGPARELERRSLEVLRQALLALPAADRPRFFREQVRRDGAFRAARLRGEVDALEKQLTPRARADPAQQQGGR